MITFQAKLSKAEVQFDEATIEFLVRYYIETPDLKRKEMGMVSRSLAILEAFAKLDKLESEAARKIIEADIAADKAATWEILKNQGHFNSSVEDDGDVPDPDDTISTPIPEKRDVG